MRVIFLRIPAIYSRSDRVVIIKFGSRPTITFALELIQELESIALDTHDIIEGGRR